MRVLVTGAAGFVGSHLLPRLARDHEVIALVRRLPERELPTAKTIVVDLTTPSFTARLPRDIDVVVHLAQAYKAFPEHAAEILAVNATSTQRLAEHAHAAGVRRFVFASSGSVYAPSAAALAELDAPNPTSYHPATKLMAEQILSYYSDTLDTISLRLFAPYGPGQVDRLIPRLISAVRAGTPISLSRDGEPRLQPMFITDVIDVFAQAVDGAGNGIVNVAGPVSMSIREIAEIAGNAIGRPPIFVEQDRPPHGDLIADTSRLKAAFNVPNFVIPEVGLRKTIDA